ncbi:hypothetical protein ABFU27_17385 [Xanthomonas campestris pv. raphani]|uniref:hypothetical protein n=1 Tax=Xanthomonas campestris TaxID=339 RepID=UPI002B223958|nr:hypothetical protein [Xanthomonas campestris]MEA9861270.1 hypothetical protein [Xanthomonas campestris pv. raphani]MEA9941251.1 hypothetical protein [Xanthomonas campestris pv. raphani]
MTYFVLPPHAAATPCLALVKLLPTLALITPVQMRRLTTDGPQFPPPTAPIDGASHPQRCDRAVGELLHGHQCKARR